MYSKIRYNIYPLIFSIILSILIFLNSIASIISFVFFGFVISFLFSKILFSDKSDLFTSRLNFLNFYLFNSILGLCVCLSSYYCYDSYFNVFGDDLYFYENILNFNLQTFSTEDDKHWFTTLLNYIIYNFISIYKEPSLIDFLFSHWALASIILLITHRIAEIVSNGKLELNILIFGLLGHSAYYFSLLSFYRDTYVILFYVLSIYLTLQKSYLAAIPSAIIAGLFRGINGLYAILFSFIFLLSGRKNIYTRSLKVKLLFICFLVGGLLSTSAVQQIFINRAKSLVVENVQESSNNNLSDFIESRQKGIIEEENLYGENGLGEGYIFYIKALLIPFLSPGNLVLEPFESKRINLPENRSVLIFDYFNVQKIFIFFSVLVMPFLLAKLVISFFLNLFYPQNKTEFLVTILFVLFYLTCAYVSLIPRHYLMFLVLVPSIIAAGQNNPAYSSTLERKLTYLLYIFVLFNTVNYYLR